MYPFNIVIVILDRVYTQAKGKVTVCCRAVIVSTLHQSDRYRRDTSNIGIIYKPTFPSGIKYDLWRYKLCHDSELLVNINNDWISIVFSSMIPKADDNDDGRF